MSTSRDCGKFSKRFKMLECFSTLRNVLLVSDRLISWDTWLEMECFPLMKLGGGSYWRRHYQQGPWSILICTALDPWNGRHHKTILWTLGQRWEKGTEMDAWNEKSIWKTKKTGSEPSSIVPTWFYKTIRFGNRYLWSRHRSDVSIGWSASATRSLKAYSILSSYTIF